MKLTLAREAGHQARHQARHQAGKLVLKLAPGHASTQIRAKTKHDAEEMDSRDGLLLVSDLRDTFHPDNVEWLRKHHHAMFLTGVDAFNIRHRLSKSDCSTVSLVLIGGFHPHHHSSYLD